MQLESLDGRGHKRHTDLRAGRMCLDCNYAPSESLARVVLASVLA